MSLGIGGGLNINLGGYGGMPVGGDAALASQALNDTDQRTSIFGTILTSGTDIFKTILGYKVATQQVKAGQYPSAIGTNGNMSGTANIPTGVGLGLTSGNSTWLLLALAVIVLVLLVKR